jgi:16S rRNA (cytidine1402-2'-O)-methyltransferase
MPESHSGDYSPDTPASGHLDLGHLYIVATPIGNLDDISSRALKTLSDVDYIAAEDTRHTARLLGHFNITTPLIAYHDHSDQKRLQKISDFLLQGKSIALVSDAGTPLISDPGYQLVKQVRAQKIPIVPIPGACAMVAALSVSGLPSDRFIFEGFLPAKSTARKARLADVSREVRTLIFYESTHRLLDSLKDMLDTFGADRIAVIARELTKTYETVHFGRLSELLEISTQDLNQQKGEFVILVSGYQQKTEELSIGAEVEQTMNVLLKELSIKQAAAIGAKLTGLKKRDLYQWALDHKELVYIKRRSSYLGSPCECFLKIFFTFVSLTNNS